MAGHEQPSIDGLPGLTLDADTTRKLGLARGFEWTLDEASAICAQLVSTSEGLRRAARRIDTSGEGPASGFQPGGSG